MKEGNEHTILKDHGLKITPIRKGILNILRSSHRPFAVKDIINVLHKSIKRFDTVTVYRTLHTLKQKNIVQSVHWGGEALLYELVRGHHHHIVCTRCGDVEDIFESECAQTSKNVLKSSKKFFSITKHSFELFGICTLCSKK